LTPVKEVDLEGIIFQYVWDKYNEGNETVVAKQRYSLYNTHRLESSIKRAISYSVFE